MEEAMAIGKMNRERFEDGAEIEFDHKPSWSTDDWVIVATQGNDHHLVVHPHAIDGDRLFSVYDGKRIVFVRLDDGMKARVDMSDLGPA
jgi:hypothetical protein